jgi:hypothetical protein
MRVRFGEKVAKGGSGVMVDRGSRKGEGNGGADSAVTGGKKEAGALVGSRQIVHAVEVVGRQRRRGGGHRRAAREAGERREEGGSEHMGHGWR